MPAAPELDFAAAGFTPAALIEGIQTGMTGVGAPAVLLVAISIGIGWVFNVAYRAKKVSR